jgi:carnitine 3-dehydrogenase
MTQSVSVTAMTNTISQKIAVVGTGVIGASWAVCFLARGYRVVATEPGEGAEGRLQRWVNDYWPTVEHLGLAAGASRNNLSFTRDISEAVRDTVFIQENSPERLDIKHAMLAEIEAAAPAGTVIATSTSGLLISEVQAGAKHPERIVLGHPFNPPHLIPLVEVLGGKQTSPENVSKAMAFYTTLGKKPIRINQEIKGYIANRLQVALWQEALSLVERGVVSVKDIDTAIANGPGLRWALPGPFLNLHASGGPGGITHTLQHLGPPMREWARDLGVYPASDDYIAPVAQGVAEELKGYDFQATLRERDELLVNLIAAKKETKHIP